MKILIISSTFPYPPHRGGTQIRTFNLLKYLGQKHHVTLVTQTTNDVQENEIQELAKWVSELKLFSKNTVVKTGALDKVVRFTKFLQQRTPPNVLHSYSPTIQKWIEENITANKFDIVTCEHSINEIYIRPQWQEKIRTVVNIHSSVYQTCQNQLATKTSENPLRDRLYLPLLYLYEKNFCHKFSCIVVTTKEDKKRMLTLYPQGNISVIPNGVDLETFSYRQQDPGGYSLIFFGGMDYIANIDAACFLARDILPPLQQIYPQTTLSIVGSNPGKKVLQLETIKGVKVIGRVPSIPKYLHQATVCVVPMRTGFGIKNKTLEAMATGTPVVGSDRGLEGIEVSGNGIPVRALRANTVSEYVDAIALLFKDAQLRETLSHNGRNLIEQQYTWSSLAEKYEQIILGKSMPS